MRAPAAGVSQRHTAGTLAGLGLRSPDSRSEYSLGAFSAYSGVSSQDRLCLQLHQIQHFSEGSPVGPWKAVEHNMEEFGFWSRTSGVRTWFCHLSDSFLPRFSPL